MSAHEWRYLPGGSVRHAITMPADLRDQRVSSACGIGPWHLYDWRGTGSQGERDLVETLPDCKRCTARLNVVRVPLAPRPRSVRLDVAKLYAALEKERVEQAISGRELLRQVGENTSSSLTRIGGGAQPSADLLVRLLVWLGTTDVGPFLTSVDEVVS